MDVVLAGPFQPVAVRDLELDVDHAVDQRRGHRFDNGAVLGAVARADDDRAFRQDELADAPVLDERIERLLHLVGAGVELVQEQAVRVRAGDQAGRAEPADAIHDLRHADQVLRRELRAEQRDAGQATCAVVHIKKYVL